MRFPMTEQPTTVPPGEPEEVSRRLKEVQLQKAIVDLRKARRVEAHEMALNAVELRRAAAVAETAEIDLSKRRREHERELARSAENLTYTFCQDVDLQSVQQALDEL